MPYTIANNKYYPTVGSRIDRYTVTILGKAWTQVAAMHIQYYRPPPKRISTLVISIFFLRPLSTQLLLQEKAAEIAKQKEEKKNTQSTESLSRNTIYVPP
jgi:hypothetical protein